LVLLRYRHQFHNAANNAAAHHAAQQALHAQQAQQARNAAAVAQSNAAYAYGNGNGNGASAAEARIIAIQNEQIRQAQLLRQQQQNAGYGNYASGPGANNHHPVHNPVVALPPQSDTVPIRFRTSPFYRVEKALSGIIPCVRAGPGDRKVVICNFALTEAQRALLVASKFVYSFSTSISIINTAIPFPEHPLPILSIKFDYSRPVKLITIPLDLLLHKILRSSISLKYARSS
jgi:hypothetical protein